MKMNQIRLKLFLFVSIFLVISHADKARSPVLELNEKFLEVKDDGHWFVEFYAPWCGHCKKLQPIWEMMAIDLAEKTPRVRVARIDCTRFTEVASNLSIHGYPSIKYFREGSVYTYEGDRSREALVDFALRLEGPDVRFVGSSDTFLRVYSDFYLKGGHFVLIYDNNNETHNEMRDEYRSIAKDSVTKAKFAEIAPELIPTNFTIPNVPCVMTFKDSDVFLYTIDMQESLSLKDWIESERWPLMPLINYGNLYEIGLCCQKLLVIVVSDMVERSKSGSAVKIFHELTRQTAKQYRQELKQKYQFVWTDGNEMANNILLSQTPMPYLLVFDANSYYYYLPDDQPPHATKESIFMFLKSVANGQIEAHGGKGLVQRLKRTSYDLFSTLYNMFATQPLLSCCLFGLPLGVLSVICYTLCSTDATVDREEIYKDSEDEDDFEHENVYSTPDHDDSTPFVPSHDKYD